MFHDRMSSCPDDGTCDLYVHFKPANALQNIAPIITWLKKEYQAEPIFPTSLYIASDNLYEENNVDSFLKDLTEFLGAKYTGLEVAICPTNSVHQLFFEPFDEKEEI